MTTDKSKSGGSLWRQLLHRFDSSGTASTSSAVPVPQNGHATSSATLAGSVTSAGEAFEGSNGSNCVCHQDHHEPHHRSKSAKEECCCPSCPCTGKNGGQANKQNDVSVVDMIRSLDAFASRRIDPSQEHWIESLHKLMTDYYLNSSSTNVRLRALEILSIFLHDFSYLYEDLVIDTIVIKVIRLC